MRNPEAKDDSVSVYDYHIVHDTKDIHEKILAVSDRDAFEYLDAKYGVKVWVVAGGTSAVAAKQVTPKAKALIAEFE